MSIETKLNHKYSEWKMPTNQELKKPNVKEIEKELKPWYLQAEKRHMILGGDSKLQEKVDKINALFELGMLPKFDKETGDNLQSLYIGNEVKPGMYNLLKTQAEKKINFLKNELIGYLDKWEQKKTNPPKEYQSLDSLIEDLRNLSKARFGEYSQEKKPNPITGLPEDENDIIENEIKTKLESAGLK